MNATTYETLHYATIRNVPFASSLVSADVATLISMTSYGWLRCIDKGNGRCAWQITDLGREVHGIIEWLVYGLALITS